MRDVAKNCELKMIIKKMMRMKEFSSHQFRRNILPIYSIVIAIGIAAPLEDREGWKGSDLRRSATSEYINASDFIKIDPIHLNLSRHAHRRLALLEDLHEFQKINSISGIGKRFPHGRHHLHRLEKCG
mmetsp:Transcript_6753/g.14088  ORF Transcript_6753/g.14088 Transcript_6753/m.14088 type:complete len:128 (-) Transcript_6753:50-433(-)